MMIEDRENAGAAGENLPPTDVPFSGDETVGSPPPTTEAAGDAPACAPTDSPEDAGDTAPMAQSEASVTEETESAEDANRSEDVSWRFGEAKEGETSGERGKERRGARAFTLIFAGVIGVSLLLLFLTLWIGDGGFHIVRTIHTERTVFVRENGTAGGLLTPEEAAETVKKSTVTVSLREMGVIGSGFIYRADGYIVTNRHVIASGGDIEVILATGEVYGARVVGADVAADVAVLKIDAAGLPAATLGDSSNLLTGEDALAVGTPAEIAYAGTVTFGKISSPERLVPVRDSSGNVVKKLRLIQTDTAINNGNSGGPLADMYGRVIGVNVIKLSNIGDVIFEGMGFALPINGVREIADAIIEKGSFEGVNPIAEGRSLIGVVGFTATVGYWDLRESSLTFSETEKEGYTYCGEAGAMVSEVTGMNAKRVLQVGDVILRVNGLRMYRIKDVIDEANRYVAGTTVTIEVLRAGEHITVSLTLSTDA